MIRTLLHTTLFWTYLVLMLPVLFVPALVVWALTFAFDRRGRILHYYTSFWCGHHVYLNPMWRLKIVGRENLDLSRAYVLCSNHQSAGDIPVIFNLYFPFKWVSKHSNFWVPFIGWTMYLNRYVRLVRGDMKSVVRTMEASREWLKRGVSVLMFPEGTRSKTGAFLPFKPGAFRLARDAKVPVVPIVVDRTIEALPRDAILRQKGVLEVTLRVGKPIESTDYASARELTQAVRAKMIEMQREIWALRGYEGPTEVAQPAEDADTEAA